jgi:hypothetical protein
MVSVALDAGVKTKPAELAASKSSTTLPLELMAKLFDPPPTDAVTPLPPTRVKVNAKLYVFPGTMAAVGVNVAVPALPDVWVMIPDAQAHPVVRVQPAQLELLAAFSHLRK